MPVADWTYELPPAGSPAVWLEEYLVYDADAEPAGKVAAVLERAGDRLLVVERAHLPLRHDLRAVPFAAIDEIDHDAGSIYLRLTATQIEQALELDPAKGSEDGGEASRVVTPTAEELPSPAGPGAAGPVDRGIGIAAPLVLVFATVSFLGAVVVYEAHPTTQRLLLFLVPVALVLFSAFLGYRWWARPWSPVARSKP